MSSLREISGRQAHGASQVLGVAHEGQAAVIGNVQPLMGVGGPGIRVVDAGGEVGVVGAGCGPQPESSVHVYPGAGGASAGADFGSWIEGAGVDVAGLHAQDAGRVQLRKLVAAHAALAIHRHADHALTTEAEHAQRLDQRGMRFLSDHHLDFRGAEQAAGFHIPSGACQHGMARGG